MKKTYKNLITVLGIFIAILFLITISYFLWKIEKNDNLSGNDCVDVIYSDEKNINLLNPEALKDSDGKGVMARSISIINNCPVVKTIELDLNILNSSTIASNKIKAYVNGDITLEPILLTNLKELKSDNEDLKEVRRLYKYDIDSGKSIRLNLRLWLDEYATISKEANNLNATYEITVKDQVIKPTFIEKIMKDNNVIVGNIDYGNADVISGLYKLDNSYYYRGNPDNNYFKIDDYIFRIVAVNSDNSIKLVYVNDNLISPYDEYGNQEGSVVFKETTSREYLESWFNENLSKYNDYLVDSNFCSDTSYKKFYSQITYGANKRVFQEKSPSLTCLSGDRGYDGNFTSKVGLLSADEMAIIGLSSDFVNTNSYIYNGHDVCSLSPYSYYYNSYVIALNDKGQLGYLKTSSNCSLLPVVNISGHLQIAGSGTADDPYVLDLDD